MQKKLFRRKAKMSLYFYTEEPQDCDFSEILPGGTRVARRLWAELEVASNEGIHTPPLCIHVINLRIINIKIISSTEGIHTSAVYTCHKSQDHICT